MPLPRKLLGDTDPDSNVLIPAPRGVYESVWYLLDPRGSTRLLVRGSDPLELRAGDPQPIGGDALVRAYTNADLSRLVLHAFHDGVGSDNAVFVLEVPEPGALASPGAALAVLAVLVWRRRAW